MGTIWAITYSSECRARYVASRLATKRPMIPTTPNHTTAQRKRPALVCIAGILALVLAIGVRWTFLPSDAPLTPPANGVVDEHTASPVVPAVDSQTIQRSSVSAPIHDDQTSLILHVTDDEGPVPTAALFRARPGQARVPGTPMSAADGTGTIRLAAKHVTELPVDETLFVWARDHLPAIVRLKPREQAISLARGERLAISCVDATTRKGLPGCRILAARHADSGYLRSLATTAEPNDNETCLPGPNPERAVYEIETDASGNAEMTGLTPGQYRLVASHRHCVMVDSSTPINRIAVPSDTLSLEWVEVYAAVVAPPPDSRCITWGVVREHHNERRNKFGQVAGYVEADLRRRFGPDAIVLAMLPSDSALASNEGPRMTLQVFVDGHGWHLKQVGLRPASEVVEATPLDLPPATREVAGDFRWSLHPEPTAFSGIQAPRVRLDGELEGRPLMFLVSLNEKRRLPLGRYVMTHENPLLARALDSPSEVDLSHAMDLALPLTRQVAPVRFHLTTQDGGPVPLVNIVVTPAADGPPWRITDCSVGMAHPPWGRSTEWILPIGDYTLSVNSQGRVIDTTWRLGTQVGASPTAWTVEW